MLFRATYGLLFIRTVTFLCSLLCLVYILLSLSACSGKNGASVKYPVIDVVSNIGNYQRVYCSDLFSSIELIPLETKSECLIDLHIYISVTDSFIFKNGNFILYAFDRSGKFLNQIGRRGNGPEEYRMASHIFLNYDKTSILVDNIINILEYEFNGKFIRSIPIPVINGQRLGNCNNVDDNVFIGSIRYNGINEYKYCLFDSNGDIIKCFPNYIFYNKNGNFANTFEGSLQPVKVDSRTYLKDHVNDTIYVLSASELQPAYVFDFGKYSFPVEQLGNFNSIDFLFNNTFLFAYSVRPFTATSKYIFYDFGVPNRIPRPKGKLRFHPLRNDFVPDDGNIFGIYNIEQKVNVLLDTDQHFQRGIINDIDGGLPFFPRYYAGNGLLVDFWQAEDMKEMLTDEYFATQTIKDPQAHQRLKEILENLDWEDNPVVVIAKLK